MVLHTSADALRTSVAHNSSNFAGRVLSNRNGSSVSMAAKRASAVSTAVSDIVSVERGRRKPGIQKWRGEGRRVEFRKQVAWI